MNFVTTPRRAYGTREAQIILKTEERNLLLESGATENSAPNQNGGDENGVFLEADKLEVAVKTAAGCSRTYRQGRGRRSNCSDAIFPDD
jgi:hypothetical protein